MAVIPQFELDGLLPPGDYEVTFEELRRSVLVLGPGEPNECPTWDAAGGPGWWTIWKY
ncbi:MAG: hypothetical protein UZ18_ATM001000148 [Armatimonadetes bacterium OLB18]|nr:MAG: hypothetical protein UZ18_ATM001000148 [Armatimonadetes bacterium OLB18]